MKLRAWISTKFLYILLRYTLISMKFLYILLGFVAQNPKIFRKYTRVHNVWCGSKSVVMFSLIKILLTKRLWLIFMGMKQKRNIFFEKKIQNGRLKKTSFCQTVNSQYFFAKLSGMGPWVSRIDWCEGHWFGSTYMAVRLSDIRPKTGKKCIFCIFRPF